MTVFGQSVRKALFLLLVALSAVACGRHKTGAVAQPTTQTIAPATARPAADNTGTDALTQTVDVDDSRSESDGMASASTKPAKKPATRAPAKKKGKK